MEEKLREAFGSAFINIINSWPQLSAEDVREIYEKEITIIHAVYNSWEDIAKEHLNRGDCEEYIRPFVDLSKLAEYIEKTEKDDWVELSSGKLLICE